MTLKGSYGVHSTALPLPSHPFKPNHRKWHRHHHLWLFVIALQQVWGRFLVWGRKTSRISCHDLSFSSSATSECLIQIIEVITSSLVLLFSPNIWGFCCFHPPGRFYWETFSFQSVSRLLSIYGGSNPLGCLPFELVLHQPLLACISTAML